MRRRVDRPLFYAVAVIVASFLPIYVLSGPSGTLFKPMADTMVFALVGSLIVTLTLLPVLCAWFMRKGVRERRNAAFEAIKSVYTKGLDFCLAHPWGTTLRLGHSAAGSLLLIPRIGAEFMPQLDEGALWVRATMPYTISFDESAKIAPRYATSCAPSPKSPRLPRSWAGPTTAPIRPASSTSSSMSASSPTRSGPALPHQGRIDRGDQPEARGISRHQFQLHPAGRGCGGRGGDRAEERAGGQGLRSDLNTLQQKGQGHQAGPGASARHP
jgi:hypothetical protein